MLIIGKKLSPYALLSISGLLAASDQAVKWLVQQSMAYGESVSVPRSLIGCRHGTPVLHSVAN
jgi:hypothetical protein